MTAVADVAPARPPENVTKNAGRGGLAIAVAKLSFIAFGFAQQLVLPAVLGTDGYGSISQVLAVVGIVNNVVVALSIQGVSRTVASATDEEAPRAYRRVLGYHLVVAIVLATGFASLGGVLADLLAAPNIAPSLRLVGLVVLLYGLYAPIVGWLNGRRRFIDQAGLDIFYGGLRFATTVAGILIATKVMHFDGVLGGAIGFTSAAMLILPISAWRAGLGAPGGTAPRVASYARFIGPLAVGLVSLNVLLQVDFLLFSRFVGQKGRLLGEATRITQAFVGSYRAFQLFSFLPYQLLMSVTFVLFPMLAKANVDRDHVAIARYTRTGMRLAVLLVGLLAGVVMGLPYGLLRFAFADPQIAELGSKAQPFHAAAMALFALLGVTTTVLTSLRREMWSAGLTALGVGLVVVASVALTPAAVFGGPMMVASAFATLIGLSVTLVVALIVLKKFAGGVVPVLTPIRVGLGVAAMVGVGSVMPFLGRFFAPLEAAALVVIYVVVLVATREIGAADLATVRAVISRSPKK
ncbi:MAG: lipopolysaccharide biosynthesis protein [Polyangiaceae bacterium]